MKKIIESFKGKKILVIGDVMLDKYIHGSVTRISPEAPVQVVKVEKESYVPGGAANVANNIAALGGTAILLGAVGKDPGAEILTRILNEKGVATEFLVWNAPTIVKVRVVGQSQQLLRIDYEDETAINAQEISKKISKLAANADIIIISDYAKGTINEEVMKAALSSGKKVIIDPKPKNFKLYKGAFLIKPNFSEAKEIAGISDIAEISKKLKEQTGANILITKGKEGMSLFETDGANLHVPTEAREVYDVTGAGDTVTAALALSIAAGAKLKEAALIANHAAGIKVGKAGTATVSAKELLQKFEKEQTKIKTFDEIIMIAEEWRKKNKKIVFTNGCFDILHIGHTRLLQHAKSVGDILVLGLNTDASVKRLKGPLRPLTPQEERAEIMSSLSYVDYIVFFDEDTPLVLINAVKPDVLVKGSDYTKDTVVGRDAVESYGGRVEIFKILNGYSSSKIIDKLQ